MKPIIFAILFTSVLTGAFGADNAASLTLKDHKFSPTEVRVKADTPTTVICYWGTNNGGRTASAWMTNTSWSASALGNQTNSVASGMQTGTRYYFRYYATNSLGDYWAPAISFFSTLGMAALIVLSVGTGYLFSVASTFTPRIAESWARPIGCL